MHSIQPGLLYRQIREIGSQPVKLRDFSSRVLDFYISGDIHRLYKLTKTSMHALRKRIIYDRNGLMVKRMKGFDPTMRYFVTVGAGHLSGSTGIISGLRKSGYKVSPIEFVPH